MVMALRAAYCFTHGNRDRHSPINPAVSVGWHHVREKVGLP